MTQNCVFCSIAQGELPSETVIRNPVSMVIRDIAPQSATHLLVIPLKHAVGIEESETVEWLLLGHLLSMAAEAARIEGIDESGYRVVINQGPDSGQEVEHLHLHVLGGQRLGAMG